MTLLACHPPELFEFVREPSIIWHAASFGALGAMICLGYLFADAGTRGHFTWPLRILSAVGFVGICAAVIALRLFR